MQYNNVYNTVKIFSQKKASKMLLLLAQDHPCVAGKICEVTKKPKNHQKNVRILNVAQILESNNTIRQLLGTNALCFHISTSKG